MFGDLRKEVGEAISKVCKMELTDIHRDRYSCHFWARGYYCATVGNVNEETIKRYIEEQYERDRLEGEPSK